MAYATRQTPRPNEDLKRSLIEAAVESFEKSGYERATVQDIVDAAGVTKGAFYHYFSSKAEILLVIHELFLDHEFAVLERVRGRPAPEALATLIEALVGLSDDFNPAMAVVADEQLRHHLQKDSFQSLRLRRDLFEKGLVDLIDGGIADGDFRCVGDSRLLAFGILGMCSSVHRWYRTGGISARQIGRDYAEVLLRGLAHH